MEKSDLVNKLQSEIHEDNFTMASMYQKGFNDGLRRAIEITTTHHNSDRSECEWGCLNCHKDTRETNWMGNCSQECLKQWMDKNNLISATVKLWP